MSLSLILHPPADQMFISDAADKRGSKKRDSQSHAKRRLSLVVLSHFLSPDGGWGERRLLCQLWLRYEALHLEKDDLIP